jgi:DNA-binding LacI/PurR family transcriptional regulator
VLADNQPMPYSSAHEGIEMPRRLSLVAQTVKALKKNISTGFWSGQLPGENSLCASLHVSRVTLRKALAELVREGWVRGGRGRRRDIVARPRRLPVAGNRVVLLSEAKLHLLHPFTLYWMDCLREHLNESGYHLEVHSGHHAFSSGAERALTQLEKRLRPVGWVLYRSNEPMQQWFSRKSLPCVIAGSRHSRVELPSVDVDYRATCRHAVGQFLARKHRQIVFLNPESGAAGDMESEQGFLEAAQSLRHSGGLAEVVRHDGTVPGICRKLDLLLARPVRPTAFLVSRPAFALTAATHLLHRQLRLPQDVALISRDNESFLENAVPSMARYASNPTMFARKISRLVLEMVQSAVLSKPDVRLMPAFIPGETLG